METNKQRVTVTVLPDLMARLQRETDALGITVQQHASVIVAQHINETIKRETFE